MVIYIIIQTVAFENNKPTVIFCLEIKDTVVIRELWHSKKKKNILDTNNLKLIAKKKGTNES